MFIKISAIRNFLSFVLSYFAFSFSTVKISLLWQNRQEMWDVLKEGIWSEWKDNNWRKVRKLAVFRKR